MKQYLQAILIACLLSGACGGGGGGDRSPSPTPERPPSPAPEGPSPSPGTVIRGGERLGWDQSGTSQPAVQGFSYILYVDGVPRTLTDIRCTAAATSGGYPCSGQLPALTAGGHILELAAVDGGVEGPRSAPFRVTVNLSSSAYTASELVPTSSARIVCLDSAVDDCYNAVTIAAGTGTVTDLTVAPDGRIFFIENARAVRVIAPEGLAADAALMSPDGGERLVSLALSRNFLENRFVYVGSVEERRGGAEFTVRRYREVAGVLGQGATFVTGLPVNAPGARVPIAIDSEERVYVALPAADESVARMSAFAFNGNLLRFAADGSVPADQASPILARGYERPSSLAYEPNESRMWLAGSSTTATSPVAAISLADTGRLVMTSAQAPVRMPAVALRKRGETLEIWLAEGGAYRAAIANGAVQRLQPVETGLGELSGVAAASQSDLIMVVRPSGADFLGSEIVRLAPRTSVRSQ